MPRPLVSVPAPVWDDLWPGRPAPVRVVRWDLTGPVPHADRGGPEIVVPGYLGDCRGLDGLHRVPALRAVQLLTAGYDGHEAWLPPAVTLCNARGVHDASTAELAVGLMITSLRRLDEFARDQARGHWGGGAATGLADRRVLVVGAGSIAGALVRRLDGFDVHVTRVGTRARTDDLGVVESVADLPRLLPLHDVVVLLVPLTGATRGLVDADFLARMPDGALLVNVARGPVVDTDALVHETSRGRLRAALDVTDPEPLPQHHPLWRTPGVFVSPHVGGHTAAFTPRARALLRRQFEAHAAGEPLANVVVQG